MTCEPINPDLWRITFSEPEAGFIINVLARLGRHYQEDIGAMPPSLRAYWRGAITPQGTTGPEDLKESQEELAEARTELRADRLAMVDNWMREFDLSEDRDPWKIEISTSERDDFVSMLNDRRMTLALEMGITEEEMAVDPDQISKEARRAGILEIDVLGHFILVMLGPQIYRPQ
jgi:hypothetical protein